MAIYDDSLSQSINIALEKRTFAVGFNYPYCALASDEFSVLLFSIEDDINFQKKQISSKGYYALNQVVPDDEITCMGISK